jgi:hypothetical protein
MIWRGENAFFVAYISQHFIRKRKEQRFDGFLRIIPTCRWLEDFVGEKRKEFGGFTNHHNISYSVKI